MPLVELIHFILFTIDTSSCHIICTNDQPVCLLRSQPPTCHHYSVAFPCCIEAPHEFLLRIQSWDPVQKENDKCTHDSIHTGKGTHAYLAG